MLEIAILGLSFALGISLVSYRSMAQSNGWIIGTWMQNESSIPAMLGFVVCVLTVGRGLFLVQPWWIVFVAVPAGFLAGFVATIFLKNWAPVICFPLAVVSLLAQVYMLFLTI
jgi:hypothetical protein